MHFEIKIYTVKKHDLNEARSILRTLLPEDCVEAHVENGNLHSCLNLRFRSKRGFDECKYRYAVAYACGIVLRNRTVLRNVDKTVTGTRPRLDEDSRRKIDSRIAHMYSIKYNDYDSITDMVYTFLQGSDSIDLEGFSSFRMQSIYSDIGQWTEQIIEDVKMEKEYERFLSLISGFEEETEPTSVHLTAQESGSYLLIEERGKLTEAARIVGRDDIVTELIMLDPECIILHGGSNGLDAELYNELRKIFGKVYMVN